MNCFYQPTTPERTVGNRFSDRSFFEPQQFKVALDRCENSNKSCEVHAEIFDDFAEILDNFKKSLSKWRIESEKKIGQAKEVKTNRDVFLNTIRTMEKIGEPHGALAGKIREDVVQKMKSFRENEFGRGLIHTKKHDTFKKSFNKAQKPWVEIVNDIAEKWAEISAYQPDFDCARRAVKYCEGDVGAEGEKLEAAKKSLEKREKKMAKLHGDYKQLLEKAEKERASYETKMITALDETHELERKRLNEFLASFKTIKELLTAKFSNVTDLATEFEKVIEKHDTKGDIDHWDQFYGSKAALPWGVFQQLKA